jgi:hypothetical protein
MLALATLATGLVIGFIFGWLVRDEMSRPLRREGIGLGIPGEWASRQSGPGGADDDA